MAVYVDDADITASVSYRGRKLSSRWCHLTADSREELDAFAVKLGMRKSWIQHPGTWKEHYDLTEKRRDKAVLLGAVEVNWKEHVKFFLLPRSSRQ